jgi:hypothetical protein
MQLNRPFRSEGGRSDIASGYAVVTVEFGRNVVVYGSVVDNGTNDPTPIPPLPSAGALRQWIANAAHNTGLQQSVWRTDLALLNLSGRQAALRMIFHGPAGDAQASFVLEHGEQRIVRDVVAGLGAGGAGSLEIVSDSPVLASSRTFNSSSNGTFGQYYGGVAPGSGATAGETRWLTALRQDASFRTNISLLNTGGEPATVRVRLFESDGHELATATQILQAGAGVQLLTPFTLIAGRNDITAGYARVEVDAGDGVLAVASVMDNSTNDPTTVEPLR